MENYFNTIPFSEVLLFLTLGALMHFIFRIIDIYIIPLEKGKRALINKYWQRIQIISWFIFTFLFYASIFWTNRNLSIIITLIVLGLGWNYWTNIFAGILIKYNNRLKVGDIIKTDFVSGKIKTIKLSHSELVNSKGELVIIPNEKLRKSILTHQLIKSNFETHSFIVDSKIANTYDAVNRLVLNCPYLSANQKIKIEKIESGEYKIEATLIDYSFVEKINDYFKMN